MIDFAAFAASVDKMSFTELEILNRIICNKLKYLNSIKQIEAGRKFSVGDTVSFLDKHNKRITGTVLSILTKTIKVKVGMVIWKVSPSLCDKNN